MCVCVCVCVEKELLKYFLVRASINLYYINNIHLTYIYI